MISSFSELKSKKILVIDTETTGLPETKFNNFCKDRFYPFKQLKKYNKSRMVQISWTIVEIKLGTKYNVKDYIVKPNNFYVPNSDFLLYAYKVFNRLAFIVSVIQHINTISNTNFFLESFKYAANFRFNIKALLLSSAVSTSNPERSTLEVIISKLGIFVC